MLSFQSFNTILILVLSVLASSINGQDNKNTFTLHQIESKVSVKSGPAAALYTYHKYNRRAPENVKSAAAANRGTVVASQSDSDEYYLTPITIGGQTLHLLIDTGSDFLWVHSEACWFSSSENLLRSLCSIAGYCPPIFITWFLQLTIVRFRTPPGTRKHRLGRDVMEIKFALRGRFIPKPSASETLFSITKQLEWLRKLVPIL